MSLKYIRVTFILILFCFLSTSLNAQNEKVGVVLSGGGAKGLAHVGVLKALEENNIPVDYITGTSIGALIGGLYASGFSVDSIENIVTGDDFQNWATGEIPEEYNYFYKKRQSNASWVSLRFDIDSIWQPKLPTSLIAPYQMDFAGMEYLSGVDVASDKNFDNLYIPFRCVAADIENKEEVVFRHGEVYEAIRASLSYPFVFRPISVDDRLLFDGGIYNNFPLDIMIEDFQPDYVIGSAVGMVVRPLQQDDVRSHLENLVVFPTDYEVPDSLGLTIRPNVPDVGLTDFSKAKELMDEGYKASIAQIEQIKNGVSRRIENEKRQQKREAFVNRVPELIFEDVSVNGINPRQEQYIKDLLLLQEEYVDIEDIRPLYFKLLADDHIEHIRPKAKYNEDTGYYTLELDITIDESFVLKFGGNLSSSPVNQAYIDAQYLYLGYRAATLGLNGYFGRFYSSLQLQGRIDFPLPLPFFIETSLTMNYYDYFESTTTFLEDRTPSYLLQNQNFYDVLAGFPVGTNAKFTTGFVTGQNRDNYFQTNVFSRTDTTDETTLQYISPYIYYERNTLNRKQFPASGTKLSLSARYISGEEAHTPGSTSRLKRDSEYSHDWFQARLIYENYFKSYNRTNLGFYSELLLSNKDLFSNYTSSALSAPSFRRVPSSRTHFLPNYRAHNYAVGGLNTIINITDRVNFRIGGYVFQPYREILRDPEDFTAYYGEMFAEQYFLGTATLGVNTALGPLSVSVSYFDRHDELIAFSVDFGYLIFNQLPLR